MAKSKEKATLFNRYPILRFMHYGHLPERLQEISRPFCELAWDMAWKLPYDPETSIALRKLKEAKDAAVSSETVR